MIIRPAKNIRGEITLPGDKSISHRAAMIAAAAAGVSRIENFAASADCSSTLDCMRQLGVSVERSGSSVAITGIGGRSFLEPVEPLDCGNSGTTMRLLTGLLAGQRVGATLIGDKSLSSRPMRRIIEPLSSMGAEIGSSDGRAPLAISAGKELTGIEHRLRIASAQIKSAIMLAGLGASGTTVVVEPAPTRDHTERMLRWFGARVDAAPDGTISVKGGQHLAARDLDVPGDISSAAFFLIAAACLAGSDLALKNVGLNPTRTGILDVLERCGVDIEILDEQLRCNEPVGNVTVRGGIARSGEAAMLDGKLIANVIDEIPIIAVLGTQLPDGLEVRDAGELRVKESDRISSVVKNLTVMGAEVEEFEDGFRIGRSDLTGAVVDSFGDHRIAMAFAIAGLLANGETEIVGADCVNISFPGFFETLQSVVIS